MFFNSIAFAIFLPIIFILYWSLSKADIKYQNFLIVVASYFFYGWWDWRFLALILFSTIVDYVVAISLTRQSGNKKILLGISIAVNIGLLGFFKYFNFFLDNIITAFSLLGIQLHVSSLKIILPVGISFYTFQTLSYTIDVYKQKIQPTRDFIAFAAYVSFFPQLVAGPIERATTLLPQFLHKRKFKYEYATNGMRQILWGFFKKIVIADNCAKYADLIFNNSADYSGSTLVLGAVLFTFQIYGDFSGYSDIAIGTARLFGFKLMQNFNFPYFSRDVAEFWRRWHISLTSWFRDYIYIPLGGSRGSSLQRVRNVFIVFIVSGFWHGANWTFIVWGLLNAMCFLPLMLFKQNRNHLEVVAKGKIFPSVKEFFMMIGTFAFTVLAWIFFRSSNIQQAINIFGEIFSPALFDVPKLIFVQEVYTTLFLIVIFVVVEWFGREQQYAIEKLGLTWPKPLRYIMYYVIVYLIVSFGNFSKNPFVYFQF